MEKTVQKVPVEWSENWGFFRVPRARTPGPRYLAGWEGGPLHVYTSFKDLVEYEDLTGAETMDDVARLVGDINSEGNFHLYFVIVLEG